MEVPKGRNMCPEETSNLISKLFFWSVDPGVKPVLLDLRLVKQLFNQQSNARWMMKIFWKGAKRDLTIEDIHAPQKLDESEYLGNCLERSWNIELKKLKTMKYKIEDDGTKLIIASTAPNLFRAIFRTFWCQYLSVGLLIGINFVGIRTLQPVFQRLIIGYFSVRGETITTSKEEALSYAIGLVLTTLTVVGINNHTQARSMQVAMRLRVACSSLVYRKLLRLKKASLNDTKPGQIINLLSNDVDRFDAVATLLNYIWIMPCQIIVVGAVLWQLIGIVTIVGFGSILILTIPLHLVLNKYTRIIRASIATRTDKRIQFMSELIAGIQVVKMYAWEKSFEKVIRTARKNEIKAIRRAAYLRAMYLAMMLVADKIALLSCLVMYIYLGNTLSAEITFPLVTYVNIIQAGMAHFFPLALIQAGEAAVSVARLQEFLLLDEMSSKCIRNSTNSEEKSPSKKEDIKNIKIISLKKKEQSTDPRIINETNDKTDSNELNKKEMLMPVTIEMQRVCANWIITQLPPILYQVSLTIEGGNLCALVGQVASGKSSLLNLILQELPLGSGTLRLRQRSKEAFTEERTRGFLVDNPNLRISYVSQEPWLFFGTIQDNIVFGQSFCAKKYEEVTKVCALRRDFKNWPKGDQTLIGENGITLSGGQKARINLARAVYKEADLYLFDDPMSAVDHRVARYLFEKCITGYLHGKTRILVTHQVQFLKTADTIVVLDRGTVKDQGSFEKLNKRCSEFRTLLDELQKTEEKSCIEKHDSESTDTLNEEEKKNINDYIINKGSKKSLEDSTNISTIEKIINPWAVDNDHEVMNKGRITGRIYKEFFKSGGSWLVLVSVIFTLALGQVANSTTDYWISYFTNVEAVKKEIKNNDSTITEIEYTRIANSSIFEYFSLLDNDGLLSTDSSINIYIFLVFSCIVFNIVRTFYFMYVCTVASQNLHDKMLKTILNATMRFFNANPSGRILNRFSKDIGTMDEMLPKVLLEAIRLFLSMLSVLMIIIYLNPSMAFPLIMLGGIFFISKQYYLRTSQSIRRIEGVTKSPVFSHVKDTLNGLVTIRNSGPNVIEAMRKKFDALQDVHSGVWYLSIMASSTLGFYLDLVACSFIGCMYFSFILFDDGIFGGNVGLAISQALMMTGILQHGVRQSTEAMTYMTAVERIVQYTDLPTEGLLISDHPPPISWPEKGKIIIKNLFLRYRSDDAPVLKNLNLSIQPGWKVSVVGRTGAGKSSLITALFRLENSGLEGTIMIDDVDTSILGLHELRSKISIIPQEPVLFSGSIRHNLDPFRLYTDVTLWRALEEVDLNELSLDQRVKEGGSNFSVGQRQLICLARAILKDNRILVLDEATANVDSRTDSLIQQTLRTRFAKHTVIKVAHRLNNVIDSDRVLVMDSGRAVEFGCPNHLLRDNPNGPFSRMVYQAGSSIAKNLAKSAKNACHQNLRQNCY